MDRPGRWHSVTYSDWRASLETVDNTSQRFYVDFRQSYYPPQTDTTTYTVRNPAANTPGEFNLTGGYAQYLLDMPDEGTLSFRILPTFDYDDGSDQNLFSWYISATIRFRVYYRAADDKYVVTWQDGGTERELASAAYVDNPTLQTWTDLAVVWDISAQTGELYINGSSVDDSWDVAPDAKTSSLPTCEIRAENTTVGAYEINHARFFSGTEATDADVANDFRDIEEEETFWFFEDVAIGETRTNITRHVASYNYQGEAEKPEDASIAANKLTLQLWSEAGEFADDQNAAWDPANDIFNGESTQKYMQSRCPVWAEHWYAGDFEPFFVGRVDEKLFKRRTPIGGISGVKISCDDFAREMATATARKAKSYEDKKLSDATTANSLVHLITREASQRVVFNFASNSSFENATIGDSWAVAGAAATFDRVDPGAGERLFGTYQGDLVRNGTNCSVTQTILFTGDKKLNVGEAYTFSVYLKSAAACGDVITIFEDDSIATNDNTPAAWTRAGGEGWTRFDVTHTITDPDSDRLRIVVDLDDEVTLSFDGAMLVYGTTAYNWFVLNDNDGDAGVEAADDADSDAYDQIGFDVDAVNIVHPFAILEEGANPWKVAQEIADGTVASYMGIGKTGALRFRSPFKTGFSDPTPLLTITDVQDIQTHPDDSTANTLIIEGVTITKGTAGDEIWNGITAGFSNGNDYLLVPIANGDYWPDRATYPGGYWAKYANVSMTVTEGRGRLRIFSNRRKTYRVSYAIERQEGEVIIGASSFDFVHHGSRLVGLSWVAVPLVENVFDTTTRADAARIELYNNSGNQVFLSSAAIRGKLVKRFQNRLHDSYVDEESVYRDGEVKFEVGNNFIVTDVQVNQIADYWAKYFRTKKHEYTVSFAGERLYLEPGEWYTLDVGGAGTKEDILSTVRCLSVKVSRNANGLGKTTAVFQEIQADWKFDSNAIARAIASGQIGRLPDSDSIKVASSTYTGKAHSRCDGTADETEIQAAIDHVAGLGGGIVQLTAGQYNTTAALTLYTNVVLRGVGANTIIEKDANDYAIEVVGSDGAEIVAAQIQALKITRDSGDTDSIELMRLSFADYTVVQNVTFADAYDGCVNAADSIVVSFLDCDFIEFNGTAIYIDDCSGTVQGCSFTTNNIEKTAGTSGNLMGIHLLSNTARFKVVNNEFFQMRCSDGGVFGVLSGAQSAIVIQGNEVRDFTIENTTQFLVLGIYLSGCDRGVVSGNRVEDMIGRVDGRSGIGINIVSAGGGTQGFNNDCTGNVVSDCNGRGILNSATNTLIASNEIVDCGDLVSWAGCEHATTHPRFSTTSGVTLSDCTLARSAVQKNIGSYSRLMTKTVAAGTAATYDLQDNNDTTDLHGVLPEHEYTYRARVYVPSTGGPAATEVRIALGEYYNPGGGAQWNWTEQAASVQDSWETLSINKTINASATGIIVRVQIDSAAANTEFIYLDSFDFQVMGIHIEHGAETGNFYDTGTGTQLG